MAVLSVFFSEKGLGPLGVNPFSSKRGHDVASHLLRSQSFNFIFLHSKKNDNPHQYFTLVGVDSSNFDLNFM